MEPFKQDDEETPVIFRKYPNIRGGEVIALFPAEAGTREDDTCSSYVHVGQHGSAHLQGCINATRAAKPEEYADLQKELESAPYGYRLRVYKRLQRSFRDARLASLARMRKGAA